MVHRAYRSRQSLMNILDLVVGKPIKTSEERGECIGPVDASLQPHDSESSVPRRRLECLDQKLSHTESACN